MLLPIIPGAKGAHRCMNEESHCYGIWNVAARQVPSDSTQSTVPPGPVGQVAAAVCCAPSVVNSGPPRPPGVRRRSKVYAKNVCSWPQLTHT